MKIPEDAFIRELLPEFVDTWIQDIDSQFENIMNSRNADDMYRFGHTLKGSCFQFGLDDIANLGIELMGLSKAQNWNDPPAIVDQIRNKFVEMKTYLENNPL